MSTFSGLSFTATLMGSKMTWQWEGGRSSRRGLSFTATVLGTKMNWQWEGKERRGGVRRKRA